MDDASDDGDSLCPLCMEEMDMTDRQLRPCHCGYQICVWCWHHIMEMAEKDNTEGRCPACRTPYDKEKIVTTTISCDRWSESASEKKQRSNKAKARAIEGRKNLSNVRVIQRNLVYVVGLPANVADEEGLERREFFGQYGKILKLSVSKPSTHYSQHSISGSTVSVYVTYMKEEDAMRCIQAVNGYNLDGSTLKACLGTTKYCNAWLKNMHCNNPDCLYLHDEGTREDSFTKEEMLAKFGSKSQHFQELTHPAQRRSGIGLPPPAHAAEVPTSSSTASTSTMTGSPVKPSFDIGSSGKQSGLPAAASWGSRGVSASRNVSVRPAGVSSARHKTGKTMPNPVSSGSSCHAASGVSAAILPLTITSTSVAAAGCGSSSESSKSNVTMLGSRVTRGQSSPIASLKHNNVRNGKMIAVELRSPPPSQIQAVGSERYTGPTSFYDRLGVQEKSASAAASHSSQQLACQDDCLYVRERAEISAAHDRVTGCPKEHAALTKSTDASDDWHRNDTQSEDAGIGHQSSPSINILDVDGVSCMLHHTASESGEASMTESLKSLALVCSDELGREGKMLESSPSPSPSSSSSSIDIGFESKMIVEGCSSFLEANKDTSHGPRDVLHHSLSVGGLSIHLNGMTKPHESLSEGKTKCLIHSDDLLQDPWSQLSNSDRSLTSSESKLQESVMITADDTQGMDCLKGKLYLEKPTGQNSGMEVVEDCVVPDCEAMEMRPSSDTGDGKFYSDILPTGFDIWADGSPQDLADLVFREKNECPLASSSIELSSPWKSHSSKQSRFHFARQQDPPDDRLFVKRNPLQTDCLTRAPISESLNDIQLAMESCTSDLHKDGSFVDLSDGLSYSVKDADFRGRVLSVSSTGHGTSSAEPLVMPVPASSKSSLSAPPGFSFSTRVSSVPSLGFPNVRNEKASVSIFTEAGQALGVPRSTSTANSYTPRHAVSSSSDIEFIDPAIMAVGRGKVPASLSQTVPVAHDDTMSVPFSQGLSINTSWSPSLDFTLPVKQQSRPADGVLNSQVQQRALCQDVSSLSPGYTLNQNVDVPLSSLFPYLSQGVASNRLLGPYQDRLSGHASKIGIQELAYASPELRFPQTGESIWESWSRVSSITGSTTPRQRLAFNGIGHSNATQHSVDRTFQNRYEDVTGNKEIASKSFWEALSLSGQNDQGQYYNQRIV